MQTKTRRYMAVLRVNFFIGNRRLVLSLRQNSRLKTIGMSMIPCSLNSTAMRVTDENVTTSRAGLKQFFSIWQILALEVSADKTSAETARSAAPTISQVGSVCRG